jgi:hypothetical protein
MSDQVFFTAQAKKAATLSALKRQRAKSRQIHAPVGQGVREVWDKANLSQRRAILGEVLVAVKVLPKPPTASKRFDPAYFVPIWQEAELDASGAPDSALEPS